MNKSIISLLILSSLVKADFIRDDTTNIVKDNETLLEWKDDEVGSSMDWQSAIEYCEGLTFAGYSDWRLPNRKELESIIDDSRDNPSIDTDIFQNTTSSDLYWTSSTYASYTSHAWYVYFFYGYSYYSHKSYNAYARCVRLGE